MSSKAWFMIFSGSSRFFKISLAVALATRVNRSNKFICRLVLVVVVGAGTSVIVKLWRRVPRNALLGVNAIVDEATRANVTAFLAFMNPSIF